MSDDMTRRLGLGIRDVGLKVSPTISGDSRSGRGSCLCIQTLISHDIMMRNDERVLAVMWNMDGST